MIGLIRGLNAVRGGDLETTEATRRQFLRSAAATLAAGVGLALIPFSEAQAACSGCCPDSTCNNSCPGSPIRYRCQPGNCCICHDPVGCFGTQQCYCS